MTGELAPADTGAEKKGSRALTGARWSGEGVNGPEAGVRKGLLSPWQRLLRAPLENLTRRRRPCGRTAKETRSTQTSRVVQATHQVQTDTSKANTLRGPLGTVRAPQRCLDPQHKCPSFWRLGRILDIDK